MQQQNTEKAPATKKRRSPSYLRGRRKARNQAPPGVFPAPEGISRSSISKRVLAGRSQMIATAVLQEFWGHFWKHANKASGCFVWAGAWRKRRPWYFGVPASHVAWAYARLELQPGEDLRTTCGKGRCINPEHQAVFRGP